MNLLFKLAILSGNVRAVSAQLKHEGYVDAPDSKGYSPLMLAAERGYLEICRILVEHGADITRKDSQNRSAADLAIQKGYQTIAKMLVPPSQENHPADPGSLESLIGQYTWEADDQTPPPKPHQDEEVLATAREHERLLSDFVPVSDAQEWDDVDVELPDVEVFAREKKRAGLDARYLEKVKATISWSRETGRANKNQIGLEFCDHEDGMRIAEVLCKVLAEYDIIVDEDEQNSFDALMQGEPGTEVVEDECFMEIFKNFLYEYYGNEQIIYYYYADIEAITKRTDLDTNEILDVRDRAVWSLLTSLIKFSDRIKMLDIADIRFVDVQKIENEECDEQECCDEQESSSLVEFIETLFREFGRDMAEYNREQLFGFLSKHDYHVEHVQYFFKSMLASLYRNDDTALDEGTGWANEIRHYLETLAASRIHLVEVNLRLSLFFARKYQSMGCELSDLVQEGNIGLLQATGRFDPTRGASFATYAVWWIRQAISRSVRNCFNSIRIPVNVVDEGIDRLGWENHGWGELVEEAKPYQEVPLWINRLAITERRNWEVPLVKIRLDLLDATAKEELFAMADILPEASGPTSNLFHTSLERQIAISLGQLKERERTVIKFRYGIGVTHDHTLEEIGRMMGRTRERIRQIEAKAFKKMKHGKSLHNLETFLHD